MMGPKKKVPFAIISCYVVLMLSLYFNENTTLILISNMIVTLEVFQNDQTSNIWSFS